MINPIYKSRLAALAEKLGISNSPRIREEDLRIAQLDFFDADDHPVGSVEGTHMNLGGRLFFEQFVRQGLAIGHLKNPLLQKEMADYFAELWQSPYPSGRPLVDALRNPNYEYVRYGLKPVSHAT